MGSPFVTFEVSDKDLRRLDKKLVSLGRAAAGKIVRRGIRNGAKHIRNEMRKHVPTKTGKLKRWIIIKATKRSRKGWGMVIMLPTRVRLGIAPDAKHYYPAHLEYGYTTKSGKVVAPKSYFRRGFNEGSGRARMIALAQIKKDLETTARKGAR